MKTIVASRTIDIPKDVKLTLKGRKVTVKGPRGILTKDFSHVRLDLQLLNDGRKLRAEMWFGVRKSLACIRTVMSSVQNMMTGVTKGFVRKMRMVYAHFPIAVTIENDGKLVSVRNFLGEKKPRDVPIHEGVLVKRSDDVKDEITLIGNDVTAVSQAAANIQQIARVRSKDIRKFLDGVYVSHKGLVVED